MEISEQEAIEIAKNLAIQKNWPFLDPIKCKKTTASGVAVWKIHSNSDKLGCNVVLHISCKDGTIVQEAFWPR